MKRELLDFFSIYGLRPIQLLQNWIFTTFSSTKTKNGLNNQCDNLGYLWSGFCYSLIISYIMYLYHTSTPLLSSSTSKKNPLLSSYFHVFSPSPSLHIPLHLLRIVSLYEHWWEGIDLSKGNLSVATALKNVTPLPQQPLTAYSSSREGVAYPTHDGILRGPHLCWSRAGSTAAMIHGYNTLIFRRQFSRDLLPILWEWLWYAFCPPFL